MASKVLAYRPWAPIASTIKNTKLSDFIGNDYRDGISMQEEVWIYNEATDQAMVNGRVLTFCNVLSLPSNGGIPQVKLLRT